MEGIRTDNYNTYDRVYFLSNGFVGLINRYVLPVRRTELTFMIESMPQGKNKILDYGCASGHFAARLKRMRPECEVHAADINPIAVRYARKKYPDISFWSVDELFEQQGRFDTIVVSHVLEHIPDRVAFLKNISSLLRRGGQCMIVVPQERIRGEATLFQIIINVFRGIFKNPHLVKLTYADLHELLDALQFKMGTHTYTNYLPPTRSATRKWHAFSLVVIGTKQ